MKIHVAIVSDQILPNLIPALMERPDLVCLACSIAMAAKGVHTRLARQLKQQTIAVEVHESAPDVGFPRSCAMHSTWPKRWKLTILARKSCSMPPAGRS